jgi:hypothetical protein
MVVFKTAAVAAVVLASMSAGATTPASHSQFHSHYSQAPHSQSVAIHDKSLPRSTVAPSATRAAEPGPVRTHVSEIDRLERQSSLQLAAQSKHEAAPAASSNHTAHSETSARGSGINFSYHSSEHIQTGRSSGSGGRRP